MPVHFGLGDGFRGFRRRSAMCRLRVFGCALPRNSPWVVSRIVVSGMTEEAERNVVGRFPY